MTRNLKNILIGSASGCAVGCATAILRASTVFFPPVWVASNTVMGIVIGEAMSPTKPIPAAIAGGMAGCALGCAEVALYPVMAPLVLLEAAMLPAAGTLIGGYVGKKMAEEK